MPKGIDELPLAFVEKMNELAREMEKALQMEKTVCDSISHAVQLLLEETTGLRAGDFCEYDGHVGHLVCWNTVDRDWMLIVRNTVSLSDMLNSVMGIFKPNGEDTILFVSDLSKLKKNRTGIYCAG